jgi:type IV secretory pathway TrbL component
MHEVRNYIYQYPSFKRFVQISKRINNQSFELFLKVAVVVLSVGLDLMLEGVVIFFLKLMIHSEKIS